jgi:hypothetical protein
MLEISRSHFCRETYVAKTRFWRHKCQIRQAGELFAASSVAAAHGLSADERPAAPRNFAAGGEFSRSFRSQAGRRARRRPDCSTLERVLGFVCTLLDAREGVKSDENLPKNRGNIFGRFWDDAVLLGGIISGTVFQQCCQEGFLTDSEHSQNTYVQMQRGFAQISRVARLFAHSRYGPRPRIISHVDRGFGE